MDVWRQRLLRASILVLHIVANAAAVESLLSESWTTLAPISKGSREMTMYKMRMGMVMMKSYDSGKGGKGVNNNSEGLKSLHMHMKHHHPVEETKKTRVSVKTSSPTKSKLYPEKQSMDHSKSLKSSKKMISTKESMKKVSISKKSSKKTSTNMKMVMNFKGKGKGKGIGDSSAPSFVPSVAPFTENPTPVASSEPVTAEPTTMEPTTTEPTTTEPTTTEPTTMEHTTMNPTTTEPTTTEPTTMEPTTMNPTTTEPTTTEPTTMEPTTMNPTTTEPTTMQPSDNPTAFPSLPEEPPLFCFDINDEICGPPVWPEIPTSEENECGGLRNSPIEIESMDLCEPVDYVFSPGTCTYGELEYAVNNHEIAVIYPESCTPPSVQVGDLSYAAESWSFSLGTGHQIDDNPTFGAVEIFHSLVDGDRFAEPFKIIGIGIVREVSDPFVDRVINGFIGEFFQTAEDCDRSREPMYEGTSAPEEIANPYSMLPENPSFYQYLGSRTKPPCQEDVFWSVLSEYTTIDESEADTVSRLILDWINPLTCRFGTVADPETGSTTRPPIDPRRRPISLAGGCRT